MHPYKNQALSTLAVELEGGRPATMSGVIPVSLWMF